VGGPYRVVRIVNPNIVEIVTLDLAKLFVVNVNGLQLWRGVGPALPHPDHSLVTASTDLELLDVPLDHAPPSRDVTPDEDEDAPHDDDNEEEEFSDVELTEGPPCPEVPENLPPLQDDPDVLLPELVSPLTFPHWYRSESL